MENNILEFKTVDGMGIVQLYKFSNGYYARLLTNDGFTITDTIGKSWTNNGDYQVALKSAYEFININR